MEKTRYSRESQPPGQWIPGLLLSSHGERERHNADGHNFGVKIFQLCSFSVSLSHANLEQTLSNLTNKVGGKYFLKRSLPASFSLRHLLLRLYHRASVYYCVVMMLHDAVDDYITWLGRVFANGPRDRSSIQGHVIPRTLKMVRDTSLLKNQQYKVRIEGKVEQSWKRSCTLHCTLV